MVGHLTFNPSSARFNPAPLTHAAGDLSRTVRIAALTA
jgi:hypothetical protein